MQQHEEEKNMWDRIDLKEKAKQKVRRNYWPCVAVAAIYSIVATIIAGGSNAAGRTSSDITTHSTISGNAVSDAVHYLQQHPAIIIGIAGVGVVGIIIQFILKFFVVYQLEVGAKGFFVKNTYTTPKISDILETYYNGSMKTVAITRFLMDIFTILWTMLFFIPGIVKSYEYSMIPYILAEYPDIEWREAFRLSKEMTYGHKMDLFILDLSFIGWNLLAVCTCGIVNLFYVSPYYEQTLAEAYEVLR